VNSFSILQTTTIDEAAAAIQPRDGMPLPVLKAGGMDLLDLMKEGLIEPETLVNLSTVRDRAFTDVSADRIGAGATLGAIAESADVRRTAPVIAKAVENAATPHVRNVATAAGNLLQRPRCWYYRAEQFDCLKKGGPTCFAVEGENRHHAIFGPGPCHIVHPSNLAPALLVCDGAVHLADGRRISIPDLYHLPDRGIRDEHNLGGDALITHITFSAAPNSGFHAIKEKQSFDWPIVFACVSLTMDDDRIASARVCAGAVAPIPWPLPRVEAALVGVRPGDHDELRAAAAVAGEGATPMRDNAHKVRLLAVAVRRAVRDAAGLPPLDR